MYTVKQRRNRGRKDVGTDQTQMLPIYIVGTLHIKELKIGILHWALQVYPKPVETHWRQKPNSQAVGRYVIAMFGRPPSALYG